LNVWVCVGKNNTPRKGRICQIVGGGAAASTKHHQLGAFLLAKAAENIRGKTLNQPPVYQMRMVWPIENAGVSSIPKRAVEPTPILMRQPDLACGRNIAFMDSHQPVRSPAWKSFISTKESLPSDGMSVRQHLNAGEPRGSAKNI